MALTPTSYGDNAQTPGISAEVFVPDQLIAGNMKLITNSVIITGGAALKRGTVMGQAGVGAAAAPVAHAGNTGDGVISAVALGTLARFGNYTVKFTGATTFIVLNPNGVELAPGTAAGAYGGSALDPEINFTFTASTNAMVAGDIITIPVAAGSSKYKQCVATALDGSQNPAAILVDASDPSSGDVVGGVYLQGEFNGLALTLDASLTLAGVTAALQKLGIFVKTANPADDPA